MNILMSDGLQHALTVLVWVFIGGAILYGVFALIMFLVTAVFFKKTSNKIFGDDDPFNDDFFKGFK